MSPRSWLDDSPYDLLNRNLKGLGGTMLASAIYDVLLAVAGLVLSSRFTRWLGLTGVAGPFYLFWPLVHLTLPCFCILAWLDIKRNIVIVTGAIIARVIYALFMFFLVLVTDAHSVWAILGGISLAWAIAHLVLLRLSDFSFWEVLKRAGSPPVLQQK